MNPEGILALALFIATLVLIVTEKIHRSIAVIVASTIALSAGILTIHDAIKYIDFETLLLLASMMIIVEILEELGLFHYIAIKIAKHSGDYRKFFILTNIAVGLLTCFLSSVVIILIFSTITIIVCKIIKRDPRPLLISQVICSNIGGNATLIAEPTNMMIGLHAGISFTDFLEVMAPVSFINLAIIILLLLRFYRVEAEDISAFISELDEYSFIKDYKLLKIAVTVFLLTLALFTVHNLIGLSPAVVGLIGASIMLLIARPDITHILSRIDWSTLIFIAGFYVLVGGLVNTGIIDIVARAFENITASPTILATSIGFIGGFITTFVPNIAYVAMMIPVIDRLNKLYNISSNMLWWVLLIGSDFGGNFTPISSAPNIVAVTVSEREGVPISFKEFMKIGAVVSILSIALGIALIITFDTVFGRV